MALSKPLASKRLHNLDETVDPSLGAAAKLRTVLEPDVFLRLDIAMRISIEMMIGARDYSHHCKIRISPPSAAEASAARAQNKFPDSVLPVETGAALSTAAAA